MKDIPIKEIYKNSFNPEKDSLISPMPEWYDKLINKTYSQLTLFDVTRMIIQNKYMNIAAEKAKEFLEKNPLCGEYYDGHLLELMSKMDVSYLDKHFYNKIILDAYNKSEAFDWGSMEEKTEFLKMLEGFKTKISGEF